MGEWFAIVTFGGAYNPTPAKGPFRSVDEALGAVERFRQRHGANAGTYLAATSARIVGPCPTRRAAQGTDISANLVARSLHG